MILKNWVGLLLGVAIASSAMAQGWTAKADFINGPSVNAYAWSIRDTIYVGNTGATSFFMYDYTTNIWSARNDVPADLYERTESTAFTINGKGYVLGGIGPGGICHSDVWEYEPATDVWTRKKDFPGGKRAAAGAFVVNGKAYVGGGFDTLDLFDFTMVAKEAFWQYEPVADSWAIKAPLPYTASYLTSPMCFSMNGKGYLACGNKASMVSGAYFDTDVNTMYQYDTLADSWTKKADFPGATRSGGVAFVLGNKAYVGTGLKDYGSLTTYNDFYTYDPVSDKWAGVATPPFPERAYPIAATLSTGKAYVGTGWQAPSTTAFLQDWWEFADVTASVTIAKQSEVVTCFPNPCRNELHALIAGKEATGRYALYGMTGLKIAEGDISRGGVIHEDDLAPGLYTLSINDGGHISQGMFSVE